jgi:hypothetical protein
MPCLQQYLKRYGPYMRIITILTILILCIFSCQNSNLESSKKKPFIRYVTDTSKTHRPDYLSIELLNLSSELNLSKIDYGVDSFEMRIWISGIFREKDLYIIKIDSSGLYPSQIRYYDRYPHQEEKRFDEKIPEILMMVVDSFKSYRVEYRITSSKFIDSLKEMEIINIPSQEEIPGFTGNVADGLGVTFEIATNEYYKRFSYHCPAYYAKKGDLNSQKVLDLLNFIIKNFNFSMYVPCLFN